MSWLEWGVIGYLVFCALLAVYVVRSAQDGDA